MTTLKAWDQNNEVKGFLWTENGEVKATPDMQEIADQTLLIPGPGGRKVTKADGDAFLEVVFITYQGIALRTDWVKDDARAA